MASVGAKVIQFTTDSLRALVGGLGNPDRDKAAGLYYATPAPLSETQLSNAYRSSWIARKIVDIPALDEVRNWRNWQAEQDQIARIEAEEKRLKVRKRVFDARVKARLFGGSAIYIATGDEDLSQPLNIEQAGLQSIRYLTVLGMRDLSPGETDVDPESEYFGKPRYWTLTGATSIGNPQIEIHPSRLLIFTGNPLPDDSLAPGNIRGWGDSVLQSTMTAIKQADGTMANIASLIFEAKVDVIRVPRLMQNLASPDYRTRLLERFTLAATAKGNNGALLLDSEEEYSQKTGTFQTLPDIADRFMQAVSGAADIPVTRFLGQSPAGLSSTGESDLRNYYDRIKANQELFLSEILNPLDELLIRSALGDRPADIYYNWASLWQISDRERSEIGKMTAETVVALHGTGLLSDEALARSAVNAMAENGVLPGLDQLTDELGLPDYEMEAEMEVAAQQAAAEAANQNGDPANQRQAANDARPMTLYIRRDVVNRDDIVRWAKAQGIPNIVDDLHVTVIHTRTPMDWVKVGNSGEFSDQEGRMVIPAGGPRLIERFGDARDAVVLQFASFKLAWRHADIRNMGAEVDFDEYQPHITLSWDAPELDIAKIEPYRGEIVLGPEIFEEVKDYTPLEATDK